MILYFLDDLTYHICRVECLNVHSRSHSYTKLIPSYNHNAKSSTHCSMLFVLPPLTVRMSRNTVNCVGLVILSLRLYYNNTTTYWTPVFFLYAWMSRCAELNCWEFVNLRSCFIFVCVWWLCYTMMSICDSWDSFLLITNLYFSIFSTTLCIFTRTQTF